MHSRQTLKQNQIFRPVFSCLQNPLDAPFFNKSGLEVMHRKSMQAIFRVKTNNLVDEPLRLQTSKVRTAMASSIQIIQSTSMTRGERRPELLANIAQLFEKSHDDSSSVSLDGIIYWRSMKTGISMAFETSASPFSFLGQAKYKQFIMVSQDCDKSDTFEVSPLINMIFLQPLSLSDFICHPIKLSIYTGLT